MQIYVYRNKLIKVEYHSVVLQKKKVQQIDWFTIKSYTEMVSPKMDYDRLANIPCMQKQQQIWPIPKWHGRQNIVMMSKYRNAELSSTSNHLMTSPVGVIIQITISCIGYFYRFGQS